MARAWSRLNLRTEYEARPSFRRWALPRGPSGVAPALRGRTGARTAPAAVARNVRRSVMISLPPSLLLVDRARLHSEAHVPGLADVGQGFALHRAHVCEAARLHGAEVRLLAEEGRGHRGRGLDGLHRRHTVAHHVGELLGLVLRPRVAPGIRAVADLHALAHRLAEGLALQVDPG